MNDNTINNDRTMSGAAATLLAGRYRVVRQLGQGGMGSVWLAGDTKLDGFKVAIKMLPSVLVNNKRAYVQVKAEALVSLKLSHPNIATVRAFEEEGGNPFLVMDYIDGQTLDDYLAEKGKLTEDETIRLLKPVAAALDYAHAQGVVHRDVKPSNIMIRKDGTPFVLDFGIAREIQETMTRMTGKLSSGTLLYMSSEQLHGAAPNPAQDVYSFAAMTYECLNGKPPFSRGQIEYQIEHDTPASLDKHIAIGSQVMAGLEKTPEARPANCEDVLSKGMKNAAKANVPVNRTRIVVVWLVLAVVAFVGVGGWMMVKGGRKIGGVKNVNQVTGFAQQKLATKSGDAFSGLLERKAGDTMTIDLPGGESMEFVWCPPGSFMMGSPESESEQGRQKQGESQHHVTISRGYWMGKYEVTQRQWESVMGKNPSVFKSPDRPVEMVRWADCQSFIRKINATGKVKVSLPTEAQWEYACRAGSTTSLPNGKALRTPVLFADFEYDIALDEIAWYRANSHIDFELDNDYYPFDRERAGTHPVGKKKPNDWGLYDMNGNVAEVCSDRSWVNVLKGESSTRRVCHNLCGGNWHSDRAECRCAARRFIEENVASAHDGLRLVCLAEP